MGFFWLFMALAAAFGLLSLLRWQDAKQFKAGGKPLRFQGMLERQLNRSVLARKGAKLRWEKELSKAGKAAAQPVQQTGTAAPVASAPTAAPLQPIDPTGKPKTILKC